MVVVCVIIIECPEISFFLCAVKFDQANGMYTASGLWRVPNIGIPAKER